MPDLQVLGAYGEAGSFHVRSWVLKTPHTILEEVLTQAKRWSSLREALSFGGR